MEQQERFMINHNETTNILTIEVTNKVAFSIIKKMRELFPFEMMHSKLEIVDVITQDGKEYKNVRRYTCEIYKDKVDVLFEAAKKMLTDDIKLSIGHSDN